MFKVNYTFKAETKDKYIISFTYTDVNLLWWLRQKLGLSRSGAKLRNDIREFLKTKMFAEFCERYNTREGEHKVIWENPSRGGKGWLVDIDE